jgi:deoxyribodipyrimidine photolyase-related protein
MSKSVSIVLPHQLYKNNPIVQEGRSIYLVEEELYFKQYSFHQQKLVLHRASMQFYKQYLVNQGLEVHYIDCKHPQSNCALLIEDLAKSGVTEIHMNEVVDNWLMKRMVTTCDKFTISLQVLDSPNFLNTTKSVADFFDNRKTYFQTDFYTWQRKQRKILMNEEGKPEGGKWTYDAENRAKFPKKEFVPNLPLPKENEFIIEARNYVEQNFSNKYGEANGP